MSGLNACHKEVENGVRAYGACSLGCGQHDPHVTGLKECESGPWCKQELKPEDVPIKRQGFRDVRDCNGDLADTGGAGVMLSSGCQTVPLCLLWCYSLSKRGRTSWISHQLHLEAV